jgi:hypothetical protein
MTDDEKWYCRAYDYAWWRVFCGDYRRVSLLDPRGDWFDHELVRAAELWLRQHLGDRQPRQADPVVLPAEREIIVQHLPLLQAIRAGAIDVRAALARFQAAAARPRRAAEEILPENARYRAARRHAERVVRELTAEGRRQAEAAALARAQAALGLQAAQAAHD